MKLLMLVMSFGFLVPALAKDVSSFNQVLVETVRKDLEEQNDHQFHEKKPLRSRGPASILEDPQPYEGQQMERHRQLGPKKW